MPPASGEGGPYQVNLSGLIAEEFRTLQYQATREGRGRELLRSMRAAHEALRRAPFDLGEPLYRLPALRMQIRCAIIRPLSIDFAVCEDRPLVFLKAVRLLAAAES